LGSGADMSEGGIRRKTAIAIPVKNRGEKGGLKAKTRKGAVGGLSPSGKGMGVKHRRGP